MTASRIAYTALLYALLPQALLHLAWRSRRQRAYREHIGERFGRYAIDAAQPLIWVHAVSVGETRAAEPLIAALEASYPGHGILITHMTPTGRETGAALFGERVMRCYLPYDFPFAVERFLAHFRPRFGVVIETEIWPNLIAACRRRNIPLGLVNARMSEKSARGYRRFAALTAHSLRTLTAIAAQSQADADRLAALGAADIAVTGNIKFDSAPDPALLALGASWRAAWGASRPVLLAASTREGEEALLLEALASVDLAGLLLVIVPRHPQRFDEVAGLLERSRIAFQRRSSGEPIAPGTRVLLGDSMGRCTRITPRAMSPSSAAACCRMARRISSKRVRSAVRWSWVPIPTTSPTLRASPSRRAPPCRWKTRAPRSWRRARCCGTRRADAAWGRRGSSLRAATAAPPRGSWA